jgi:GAF domain-containing protein
MPDDGRSHVPTQGGRGGPRERARRMAPQEAFLELSRLSLDELALGQVLLRVAELARATVPGADEASVTLIEGRRPRSAASTGPLASALDERQYARGFGPCMDAALSGEIVHLSDLEDDERYPDFARAAGRAGVRASLSVGMPVPQRTVGSLNLYSLTPGAFSLESLELARAYADYAAVAAVHAALRDSEGVLAHRLEQAIAARAVVEQAKGVLIGRLGCTAEQAFALLAHRARSTGRPLADVAALVVAEAQATDGGTGDR